jgi:EAL domain-containing protein (putative c-di-GMP-specific phosphodiesterase class I)
VEDLATLDLLGRLGCDLAQGYFISRPMPAGDLRFVAGIAEVAEAILNS